MHGKMFSNEDYLLKIEACERLCRENTKEVAEMFAIDEGRLLRHRVETITASLAFLNKLSLYAKDESFHKKEDALLWKKFSDGENAHMRKMRAQGRNVDNLSPEGAFVRGQLGARGSRRSRMGTSVVSLVSLCMDDYIRKLVACFPKQGRVVQEYVKKTGFHVSEVQEAAKKRALIIRPSFILRSCCAAQSSATRILNGFSQDCLQMIKLTQWSKKQSVISTKNHCVPLSNRQKNSAGHWARIGAQHTGANRENSFGWSRLDFSSAVASHGRRYETG